MRIDDALGIAGRAGGVAHADGGVLVEGLPGEVVVDLGQPILVGDGIGEGGFRHVLAVGHDDHLLDRLQRRGELLDQGNEGGVDEEKTVPGVVDDPGDVLGEKPRIDGMADGADAAGAVPDLQMPPGVPGKRGATVAERDALGVETFGDAKRTPAELLVIGAVKGALNRARDDGAIGRGHRRVVEDFVTKQRPVLHQPKHGNPPVLVCPGL